MYKLGQTFDAQQNEIRNAVAHPLAGAPSAPKFGQFYADTTTSVLFVWNGTSWRPADAAALTDGSIKMTALATNPLARANHTGQQTASTISDLASTVKAYRHDEFAAPTAAVSWGTQRLTNLGPGVALTDGINLQQFQDGLSNALAGIDPKPSCRVYASGNITQSGLQTIDGVSVGAGDRVLCGGMTDGTKNGSFLASSGAWPRTVDADQNGEITPGAEWFIEEGSWAGTKWRVSNSGAITIGTTAITLVQSAAAQVYTATLGVKLTGTVFSLNLVAGGGLTADATGAAVDRAKVPFIFKTTITGDGATTSFAVTHNLGTTDFVDSLKDSAGNRWLVDVVPNGLNAANVVFSANSVPANNAAFRLTMVG